MEAATTTLERRVREIPPTRKPEELLRNYDGKMRVAAYCRVSTDSEEQLNSYEAQKTYYTQKIQDNPDWEMAGIYADEGISGTSLKKRAEFNKMITACKRGRIDFIITKSLSRFARNTVDCLDTVRLLKANGIGVYFEKENINTLTESSEFLVTLFSGFAQAESESLSKNVAWGKEKSAKAGNVHFQYKKMLGYRKGEDGQPEIMPEEAAIVRRIYRRYLDGCTLGKIKRELDEDGIPATAEGRFAIAKKILAEAERYGIDKKDLLFDTLAMTVSADDHAALTTLAALRRIREELGCHTSLGVSNVSFGLPARDTVNSVFFALALENGLSAAIMNPYSDEMMRVYHTYRALKGLDANCLGYIGAAAHFAAAVPAAQAAPAAQAGTETDGAALSPLQYAIVKGMRERAGEITRAGLAATPPLTLVNDEIIPALNRVGEGFEKKTVYLPQLLMSAEAAKSAFEVIKAAMPEGGRGGRATVVIATVEGDIHDIGKNIVRLLLENYGFAVVDLGRDVPPAKVADAVVERHAPLVGLSALMTTTVPAMEETIRLLRARAPWCRVMVGGAVLTKAYAERIGADYYAKDAMESVRYAETVTALAAE